MKHKPMIEQDCVFEFEGQKFESGGAFVSESHLVAYPASDGVLNNWHGQQIGIYRVLSSRPAVFFGHRSWIGERFYCMRATVLGRNYSLRGFGVGMLAKGKVLK